jgi:hypothetical protein
MQVEIAVKYFTFKALFKAYLREPLKNWTVVILTTSRVDHRNSSRYENFLEDSC